VQPAAIDAGPFKVIPQITTKLSHNDNIFNQPDQEVSSQIISLNPSVQFLAQKDANSYSLTYAGDYALYFDSGDDNYSDHNFNADAFLDLGTRNDVSLSAGLKKGHDNRGTGSSEGSAALTRGAPDEFDEVSTVVGWDFGAKDARFGASLSADYADIEYQNNRLETQFRDRSDLGYKLRVSGKVQPKTSLFVEYGGSDVEYDTLPINGITLDSDQQQVSVGVEWQVTGKTSGSVKFGQTDKNFDAASRGDGTNSSWEAEVNWAPRTYANIYFTTTRGIRETNGTGSFIDARDYSVSWVHDWSSYLHTTVSASKGMDEYEGDPREDDRDDYSMRVGYDFRRWLSVDIGYSYQDRDSNDDTFDYDKSSIFLSMDLAL
tara:strand:+ start:100197 stop:101321 length:1125 start_codon:yes stop_codon:yes gene_type:complete